MVTDTLGVEDYGVNQGAWLGLQNAKANGGVDQIAYIESVDTRDYEKNLAYFAAHGYDAIIASGIGLQDETRVVADRYVDSFFIGINQPPKKDEAARPNLIRVVFAEDQMGFVAGVLAARVSQTHIVGAVCEKSDIASMWRTCEGFRAGVKFADKNVKPLVVYRDNGDSEKLFLDENWGRAAAQDLVKRGADVIFAAGGITGQGALRAAVEAQVKAIGAERDQAAALRESNSWLITSVYGDAQFEVEKITRDLKEGNLGGQNPTQFKFLALGPKLPENLTPELSDLLAELWKGKIRTNVKNMKP
ncbi:MAG: BMP family ABC transporter substrate-binding protein [Anaerolineales bacterium]|nr:BMP family ABC transporter substrate-binding protein [Anaerolineales bacterium]